MQYQRSLEIEQRLEAVLQLIRSGKYSTPALAERLKVSIPTISRSVTALRERGFDIQAEKLSDGWRYVVNESTKTHTANRNRTAAQLAAQHPR